MCFNSETLTIDKKGRAMWTPFTYIWEILTFTTMEMLVLLPKCEKSIAVFKRCVDDMFAI